jgi:hypothetical protein
LNQQDNWNPIPDTANTIFSLQHPRARIGIFSSRRMRGAGDMTHMEEKCLQRGKEVEEKMKNEGTREWSPLSYKGVFVTLNII